MANRYWVGGTASWDTTAGTKWATTSGGGGGSAVPTAADDVFFDAASGANTVTKVGSGVCRSLNFTGFTGTFDGSGFINIGTSTPGPGNIALKLVPGMTWNHTNLISFVSTSATQQTIDTAGKTLGSVTFAGSSGSWILASDLTVTSSIGQTLGTFNTGNYNVTTSTWSVSGGSGKVLTLGSSTITITGSGSALNWSTGFFTLNAGTSHIILTAATGLGGSAGLNFYSMTRSGSGSFLTPSTFNAVNFTRTGAAGNATCSWLLSGTATISGTLTTTGDSQGFRVEVKGNGDGGTQYTIDAASLAVSNTDFTDINATGSATWDFSASDSVGDFGGNTGITFPAGIDLYWTGAATTSTSNAGNWSLTSGGGSAPRSPLPQDTMLWDSAGTYPATIAFHGQRYGDIDFTGVPVATQISFNGSLKVKGNVDASNPNITMSGSATLIVLVGGSKTITMGALTGWTVAAFIARSGTITLGGDFTNNNTFQIGANTTFDTDDYTLNIGSFNNSTTSIIYLRDSTIYHSGGTWSAIAGGTFDAGTSKIIMTSGSNKTFTGAGFTYYHVESAGSANFTLNGSNTFHSLYISGVTGAARQFRTQSGTTQTILGWMVVKGTSGANITVDSSTSGVQNTINVGANKVVIFEYVTMRDKLATGGATFYAVNSTNTANNTGWTFGTPPRKDSMLPFFNGF